MEQVRRLTTRRGALGRILGVAFGAAGVGAFAESKTGAAAVQTAGPHLTLYVTQMRLKAVGPAGSARSLPYGALVDAKSKWLGSFHSAAVDSTGGSMTMQTFELQDGTLQGMGAAGSFVILGGTGKYAGVTGSYVDRPAALLPGREFVFTFREATHGTS
jgi:hypothetical protein